MPSTPSVRSDLARLVRCYPGLHLRAIARLADTSEALAGYHLDRLSERGLVRDLCGDGYRRFFPEDPPTPGDREAEVLAVLRRPVPLEIVLHLLVDGPLPHAALAKGVGRAPSTVSYHLDTLADAGVTTRRADRLVGLVDRREVERVLIRWPPPADLVRRCTGLWHRFLRGDDLPKTH